MFIYFVLNCIGILWSVTWTVLSPLPAEHVVLLSVLTNIRPTERLIHSYWFTPVHIQTVNKHIPDVFSDVAAVPATAATATATAVAHFLHGAVWATSQWGECYIFIRRHFLRDKKGRGCQRVMVMYRGVRCSDKLPRAQTSGQPTTADLGHLHARKCKVLWTVGMGIFRVVLQIRCHFF
jgi:hypothetical protein